MNYIYYNEFGKEVKKYLSPIAKGSSGIKIYIFSDFDNSSETGYEVSASFKKADGFVAGDIFLPLSSNTKINPYNQQAMYYRELTIGNDVTDIVGGLQLSIRYIQTNVIEVDPDAIPPVTYEEEVINVTGMVTFNIYDATSFISPPQNTALINLKNYLLNYIDTQDANIFEVDRTFLQSLGVTNNLTVGNTLEVGDNATFNQDATIGVDLTVFGKIFAEGGLDSRANKIINVAPPENPLDAVNKSYVDTALITKENLINKITEWSVSPTDDEYPSAKLVKDYLDEHIYTKPEIDAKLSATYKPKGTITGTELLAITPTSDNEGFVYNISTEFTTTINFLEGAGITHRAGENVVIVEISEGVYKFDVLSGFIDLSNYVEKDDNEILTTENVTINTDVGGLPSGTTINTGTSITDLIKLLGIKTYYPTFIAPSLTLAIDVNNSVEAGYISTATLTATFNKGEIKGDLIEGVWNANTKQNDRAGDVDTYEINGVDNGGVNTKTLTDNVIEEGANAYNAKVYFTTGPQPLDSDGNNYETPLAPGNILTSKTIYGYRKLFYGLSSQATNSAEVRALSNSLLNPTNGTTFTINITSGASKVVFAYPATLQDVTEVIYKEGLNADIKGIFTKTTVSVEGANGYTAIDYKVYTYTPINPFDSPVTYEVKI